MAAEVMDFDCEMNATTSKAEFTEESELEIEMESGESLDSDGALESRVIQPIVAEVTGQVPVKIMRNDCMMQLEKYQ